MYFKYLKCFNKYLFKKKNKTHFKKKKNQKVIKTEKIAYFFKFTTIDCNDLMNN